MMRKIALTGAVLAATCSAGCMLTRPHVSPVDIADVSPVVRTAVDPDPHATHALKYAKRVQAEYHDRREAILDTQSGALIGLIPLAGYVGYEAARGGTGAHVAALAGAGLAGLSLTQVLVQSSRIKVYTQAHNAIGCGIGAYRLAAAQQGFAADVEARWRRDIDDARFRLEQLQGNLQSAQPEIDAELFNSLPAKDLARNLKLAQDEQNRARKVLQAAMPPAPPAPAAPAAPAAAPASANAIPPARDSVASPEAMARVETAREAFRRAGQAVSEAKRAADARSTLEAGKWIISNDLQTARELHAAAVAINAMLDASPSPVLEAELINHVERVMRDADAELDNTIPPMSAAAPFAAVLQNQSVPARVAVPAPAPAVDGARDGSDALLAGFVDVDGTRATLDEVSRTLARVQEEVLAALAVRAAQGGRIGLDLASCRYVATNASYQAPPVALQLGVGDSDHRTTKAVGIGKSITVTTIGGQPEHGVFITAPAAQAIVVAKTVSGDMTSFTFTVPPAPEGGTAPVPAGTVTDLIFRDRAGATKQLTLNVVP